MSASGTGHGRGGDVGMKPADEGTVHQLLGRIAYFHTLFVEPALTSNGRADTGELCCNHRETDQPDHPDVGTLLAATAWSVLDETASGVGEHLRLCPKIDGHCCATCRVAASAAAIAEAWASTERRAYGLPPPSDRLRQACRAAAAVRLPSVFAQQYRTRCSALNKPGEPGPLPGSDELPLTGELLALWENPLTATRSPVVSWLNHCTDLHDIHRVLQQRGTTK
ncbi:hypothetical protein AB0J25_14100 [Streptomyces sp. NPDC049910]|uniref:hypothetical protein n=1 Tax=Streptomyces sp. NPDC049910 TaxID=3155278 RepID=UPI0034147A76